MESFNIKKQIQLKTLIKISFAFFVLSICTHSNIHAQGKDNLVLFSGVVTDARNDNPMINAYILIKRAGRGTITNNLGYFSIYVIPGDTITFSYVGFKDQYHLIPKKVENTYSAIIELREDAKMLQEVKVYPYRSEEEFKQAFLDMQLPDQKDREALARNTDPEQIAKLANMSGMGAMGNYRNFMNQQLNYQNNRSFAPTIPFLNPFAWASFIQSVKRGDLKKTGFQEAAKFAPIENIKKSDLIKKNNGE
jgi:hypothetical protein